MRPERNVSVISTLAREEALFVYGGPDTPTDNPFFQKGLNSERLALLRAFYQKLFHGPGIFAERLRDVQPLAAGDPAIAEILAFIAAGKHPALCLPAAAPDKT